MAEVELVVEVDGRLSEFVADGEVQLHRGSDEVGRVLLDDRLEALEVSVEEGEVDQGEALVTRKGHGDCPEVALQPRVHTE